MIASAVTPHPAMILPFTALLAMIAFAPLLWNAWWQRHYAQVSLGLGTAVALYYGWGLGAPDRLLHTGIEYLSFIALIGSLFVVSGGIHLGVKGEGTPLANTVFLGIGAVVANLLGTTGASMLLIRPWLRLNKYRVTGHHVVFFIFIVSNVGGCLTPIGDPPLFLGYLRGVPFGWVVLHCWPMWLAGVGMLLAMFYWVDRRNYRRAPAAVRERLAEPPDQWRFRGLGNLALLAVILGSVFIEHPPFLREGLMIAAAVVSYRTTSQAIHAANDFNFHPIREVAVLFAGIFATMIPALDWLQANAASLGDPAPPFYFWASGVLSSILDNAPTYLSFLSTALGAFGSDAAVQQVIEFARNGQVPPAGTALAGALAHLQAGQTGALGGAALDPERVRLALVLGDPAAARCLVALSVGAVFFGACTYIGNGPNFMVKSIAEQQRVHTPSFLGYILRFTLPCMLPMLVVIWWLFFR